jgi:hypothetical protein
MAQHVRGALAIITATLINGGMLALALVVHVPIWALCLLALVVQIFTICHLEWSRRLHAMTDLAHPPHLTPFGRFLLALTIGWSGLVMQAINIRLDFGVGPITDAQILTTEDFIDNLVVSVGILAWLAWPAIALLIGHRPAPAADSQAGPPDHPSW